MSRRCRLIKPAFINGAHCSAGHEFYLEKGDPGPCEHVITKHDRVDVKNDNSRLIGESESRPLYVEIPQEIVPASKKSFFTGRNIFRKG